MEIILVIVISVATPLLLFALFDWLGFQTASGTIDGLISIVSDPGRTITALLALVITAALCVITGWLLAKHHED